jgi:hypothetical protein
VLGRRTRLTGFTDAFLTSREQSSTRESYAASPGAGRRVNGGNSRATGEFDLDATTGDIQWKPDSRVIVSATALLKTSVFSDDVLASHRETHGKLFCRVIGGLCLIIVG